MTLVNPETSARCDSEQVLLKLDDAVRLRFCDDRLVVEHLGRGLSWELPLAAVPLLARFATWAPVSDAFSDPSEALELTFALVRDLIGCGVLILRGNETPVNSVDSDRWKAWGSALFYHLESRITADGAFHTQDEINALLVERARNHPCPASFKDYSANPFYRLPDPEPQGGHHMLLDVMLKRRTCRSFSKAVVTSAQLSTLLFFTWGCTGAWIKRLGDQQFLMKTSPSGGSRHSVEVYPILLNVSGFPNGIYHYSVRNHGLEMLSPEDPRGWLMQGCGDQTWVKDCGAVFVMTAVLERMMWKYTHPRTYRVLLFDVGHLGQTFALMATSLGLGSFATAALRDEIIEEKLGLDHLQEPVFLVTGAGVSAPDI